MACFICGRISSKMQKYNGKEFCNLCTSKAIERGGMQVLDNPNFISDIKAKTDVNTSHIIISSTPSIFGYEITGMIDVISNSCVFGLGLLSDFKVILTDNFGGRSKTIESNLDKMKLICLQELKIKCIERGANAIIGVRIDFNDISKMGGAMLMVTAYGTAVNIVKTDR